MNHQCVIGELEPDDLNEIPCRIRTDEQHRGRVCMRVEIDDNHGLVDDMKDRCLIEAMLERRTMEPHT